MGVLSLETAQGTIGRLSPENWVGLSEDTVSEDDVVLYPSADEPLPINGS